MPRFSSQMKRESKMEKSVSGSSSNTKLKHRFTRMLLGSTCTTTTTTTVGSRAKLPAAPTPHPEAEPDGDCPRRCKLDQHWPFPTERRQRRAAPVVQVSINCSARQSVEACQPFLRLTKEKEIDRQRTAVAAERSNKEAKCAFSSASSIDSEEELDLFSSDEEEEEDEESRTLLSSKSFSSDSSEFYRSSRKKNTRSKSMKATRRPPRQHVRPLVSVSSKKEEAAAIDGRSFAVVKRSTDPYRDFRSSMVEMIVERGMSRARDLERLLHSYLALNSARHHRAILDAFADICEAMFGE